MPSVYLHEMPIAGTQGAIAVHQSGQLRFHRPLYRADLEKMIVA
jgi:hypothetical protein